MQNIKPRQRDITTCSSFVVAVPRLGTDLPINILGTEIKMHPITLPTQSGHPQMLTSHILYHTMVSDEVGPYGEFQRC